jgi:hypothetical protein
VYKSLTKTERYSDIPKHLEDYIARRYSILLSPSNRKIVVKGFTEWEHPNFKDTVATPRYRSHPNYRSEGVWSSFAVVGGGVLRGIGKPPGRRTEAELNIDTELPSNYQGGGSNSNIELIRNEQSGSIKKGQKVAGRPGGTIKPRTKRSSVTRHQKSAKYREPVNAIVRSDHGEGIAKILSFVSVHAENNEVIVEAEAIIQGAWQSEVQQRECSVLTNTWVLDYDERDVIKWPRSTKESRDYQKLVQDDPRIGADGAAVYHAIHPGRLGRLLLAVEDCPGIHEHCPEDPEIRVVRDRGEWGQQFLEF